MEPASPLTPEALLAHAGWMRALARGLLRNPADADEVLQEATLAALRHPPRQDMSAAWLARVVRNFAWRRLRGDAHRARREECVARAESVPSQEATLERLELQGTLLEAVRALDEPYRTLIVQRYFEERSSAEIARLSGVPAGTVRWRLKHGLDVLRARLEQRFGDAWSGLLAPIAWRDAPVPPPVSAASPVSASGSLASTSSLLQGVLAMSLVKLALAGAVVVAIAGAFIWRLERSSTTTSAAVTSVSTDVTLENATPPVAAPLAAVTETPADSRTAVAPARDASIAAAPAPRAQPATARVEVRFVDEKGTPWPGVRFQALEPSDSKPSRASGPAATSDEQGRAALEVSFPGWVPLENGLHRWKFEFLAQRAGCATRKLATTLSSDALAQIGDVVLVSGVRVSGRVLDGEGALIAGALVGSAPPELAQDETLLRRRGGEEFDADLATRTSADGTFVLEGVAPGSWRMWAHASGMRYGWTDALVVPADRDLAGVELRLAALRANDRIAGRVLDPAGAPAPFASLDGLSHDGEHANFEWLQADAQGRFELVLGRDCVTLDLTAHDAQRAAAASVTGIVPGTLDVELRLAEPRALLVRVRDGDGHSVDGVTFQLDWGATGEDVTPQVVAAGSYRLMCPAIDTRSLEIAAPGYIDTLRGPWTSETQPSELEVVLQRAARVRGRVVADGQPLADAQVELREHYPDAQVLVNGLRCVESTFPRSHTVTDSAGRFELDGDPGSAYVVRATAPGRAPGEAGPLNAGSSEELEIELTRGGVIEGHVLVAAGEPAEGTIVAVNHGDGEARTQRAGARGFFRFEGLTPGPWQVLARDEEIDPHATSYGPYSGQEPIEWSCTVEVGRTSRFDLDLSHR